MINSKAKNLNCPTCSKVYDLTELNTFATCCHQPLEVTYDLSSTFDKSELKGRENSMWRYSEFLPLKNLEHKVSLGEGMTPILDLKRIAKTYGYSKILLKNEELNPTGSFKSRGLSMAISMAKGLGVTEIVMPTAGNAGGALSAYCAAAGIKCTVIMPAITPEIFKKEVKFYGAELIVLDGLIDKCGQKAVEIQKATGAFNMSTLKEPYRLQGKKTMGFEIAEQLNWELPDVIVYPTGGGTGLIAIWTAFQEMVQMGWLDAKDLPKMVAVQSSSCCPVVDFINDRPNTPESYGESVAFGLAVPVAFGKDLIARVIKESNGYCVSVDEAVIVPKTSELAQKEGVAMAPEAGAIWQAVLNLTDEGKISKEDKILLLNTGNSLKYLDSFD
ncbi:threonine synthase [Maribacter sp. 4U21]|uniref:threonine synthase n=1 Tax=Maribacter sp. 4U21 TaxID=1889779 RepID=UPI000C149F4A|nr:threonine synthase [Maribacter sp. 4U21]PIB29406.1 threonine synthase [Maribacter sp. 4U21]